MGTGSKVADFARRSYDACMPVGTEGKKSFLFSPCITMKNNNFQNINNYLGLLVVYEMQQPNSKWLLRGEIKRYPIYKKKKACVYRENISGSYS